MGIHEAILAPELVSRGTILGVAVGYYVSAVPTADDEDFPHLVMWKVFLVPFYVAVAGFQYHVAVLTVVDCFEDCFVPFVYPVFSHGSGGSPHWKWVRSCLFSPFYSRYSSPCNIESTKKKTGFKGKTSGFVAFLGLFFGRVRYG